MAPTRAAELWVRYTVAGLANLPEARIVFLDELFVDPRRCLGQVLRHLGKDPQECDVAAAVSFLDRDLTTSAPAVPDSPQMAAAMRLHEAIRSDHDEIRTLVAALELRDTSVHVDVVRAMEHGRQAVQDERDQQARRLSEERQRERERRLQAEARAEELRERLRDLDDRTDRLKAQVGQQHDRLAELQERLQQQGQASQRLEHRLAREQTRFQRLRGRRVVRVALALAAPARPLFRFVRALRKRLGLRREQPLPELAATSDGRPDVAESSKARDPEPTSDPTPDEPPPLVGHLLSGRGDQALDRAVARTAAVRAAAAEPVTVVVPVHDAPIELERCLDSVRRNTAGAVQVLVIDDASTLDATRVVLGRYGQLDRVTVLRNDENLGFTRTVNRGFEHADGDVVILNSDTEVGPRWLERLRMAAYAADDIGSATAVSDNAGAFTVPTPGEYAPVPPYLTSEEAARVVGVGPWVLPETPTANGFCAYIRRDMLDEVGLFDAEAFPRGYGEENDLSMRAVARGWRHVVAGTVFVRHTRSASFGDEKHELMRHGRRMIDERHPDYSARVRQFMGGAAMATVRDRVRERWDRVDEHSGNPRVLHVVHAGIGGTPRTAADLAVGLSDTWQSFLLTCNGSRLRLRAVEDGNVVPIDALDVEPPIRFGEAGREDLLELYTTLLAELDLDLLHVRHLVKNSLDLVTAAHDIGLPVVLSLHDFYLVCPTIHLMDENGRFCGGVCTDGPGPVRSR